MGIVTLVRGEEGVILDRRGSGGARGFSQRSLPQRRRATSERRQEGRAGRKERQKAGRQQGKSKEGRQQGRRRRRLGRLPAFLSCLPALPSCLPALLLLSFRPSVLSSLSFLAPPAFLEPRCLFSSVVPQRGDMRPRLAAIVLFPAVATSVLHATVHAHRRPVGLGRRLFAGAGRAGRGCIRISVRRAMAAADRRGDGSAALGRRVTAGWDGLTIGDLFERIRISMPQNAPGSLSGQQNPDILAFVFSANKFPAARRNCPGKRASSRRSSSKSEETLSGGVNRSRAAVFVNVEGTSIGIFERRVRRRSFFISS